MDIAGILAQVSVFANDFFVVLILFAVFFMFAWFVGRGSFVALLFSFYGAYALYALFPYASLLPAEPPLTAFLAHVGLYAVFTFIFFVILRRVIVSDFLYIGKFGLAILSFLAATFLIALAAHTFSIASVYQLTPALAGLFIPSYFFWWFSAPAVGLLLFAR